ncbi:MAG: dienelactone hydrolase family protein, partial [Gemmatimonadales bacterium]
MDQRIIDLYDDFTHRHLDRRLFLERLAKLVGSTAAAIALLPQLESNYALAQTVPE